MIDQLRARRAQLQEYGAAYDSVIRFEEACAASAMTTDMPANPVSVNASPVPDPGISDVVLHPLRDDSGKALREVRPPRHTRTTPAKRNDNDISGVMLPPSETEWARRRQKGNGTKAAKGNGRAVSYSMRGKPGKFITLMREEIPQLGDGLWSVDQLKARLLARQPDLDVSGTAMNCFDMATRGELRRTGAGRDARYTTLRLKGTGNTVEQDYRKLRADMPAPAQIE